MGDTPTLGNNIQSYVDMIGVSCYDNIDWTGATVWHDDALYDETVSSILHPGAETILGHFVSASVPASKLAVGIPFYAYRIAGGQDASGNGPYFPGQVMTVAPTTLDQVWYRDLISDPLYQPGYKNRDSAAGNVPFLSVVVTPKANDQFVTYEDPTSIIAKWSFTVAGGYGGVVVWHIGMDYVASGSTTATKFPLSEALR